MKSDVCLVLEGTYPYVAGGVSSWVHQLIKGLESVRFSLIVIVPKHDTYQKPKYEIPSNVVEIREIAIHDYQLKSKRGKWWVSQKKVFAELKSFYEGLKEHDYTKLKEVYRLIADPKRKVIGTKELFKSEHTWKILEEIYTKYGMDTSFIDFFWAYRYSHLPILKIIDTKFPRAKIYHAISTGYASLTAILASMTHNGKFLLTEHGIYTNERRIEIEQAEWIYEEKDNKVVITDRKSPIKNFWILFFDHFGRMAYEYADEIITLSNKNLRMQVENGADVEKCRVIPNGINLKTFEKKRFDVPRGERYQIGFVGRIVPIKDLRTFIMACKIVVETLPNTDILLMGPYDEDPDYYEDCKRLISVLELEEHITFTGRIDLKEAYPALDVVVLTSISEGQPLVIMEANCCGVPCVATDVGACAELLNGRTADDIAIGPSGLVTSILNPQETADAVLQILQDEHLRRRMGESGMKRIERFYSEERLNFAYKDVYFLNMT